MRNRGSSLFALGSTIVVFGLVVVGIFGVVQLLDRMHGPHLPSGWAFVEYSIDGDLSDEQQRAVAKSIVFRMHMSRAADARWWVDGGAVTVAVPETERDELEALPEEGPKLTFGGVLNSDKVGVGPVKDADGCRKPPEEHACDRDRNLWYHLGEPALSGSDMTTSKVVEDKAGTGAYAVEMTVHGEQREQLASTTKQMTRSSGDARRFAVVYGGVVLSAEPVGKPLSGGMVRLPGFSKVEGLDLEAAVEASKYDVALRKGDVQIAE